MAARQVMIMAQPVPPSTGGIFISYRRGEAGYPASWLFNELAERFGADQIFKDVDSIKPGDDFVERINVAVASSAVLLAVIGDDWLTVADGQGRRRLDDPEDFVRLEIEAALERQIRVIPVLVESAKMPSAEQLPPSLAALARKQAHSLSSNRFMTDSEELFTVLANELKPASAAVKPLVQPPARTGWRAVFGRYFQSKRQRWIVALAAIAVITAGTVGGIVLANQDGGSPPDRDPRLTAELRGALRGVMGVAVNPNGTLVAGASSDNTVRLWNPVTGRLIGQTLTHFSEVTCVAFSADGKLLASGSWDKTIRVWNPATGQLVGQPLTGHAGSVTGVAFSPDGKILASGGDDATVRLWNAATGQPIGEPLTGHRSGVHSVAFSPDGTTLASGSEDHTARLWNVATGAPIGQPLAGHEIRVNGVAFSPDGKTLATASDDHTIRLWNPATGEPIGQPIAGHTSGVTSVAFSPDGKVLASGSWDKSIRIWDLASVQTVGTPLTGHTDKITGVAFGPGGATLASGSWDTSVRVWKLR